MNNNWNVMKTKSIEVSVTPGELRPSGKLAYTAETDNATLLLDIAFDSPKFVFLFSIRERLTLSCLGKGWLLVQNKSADKNAFNMD